jgi:AcrR family transcriptional regulator
MKTDKKIKEVSRLLFNEKGVVNVTLRDVAKTMNKSYGNITYHFATKNDVIMALFEEMNEELSQLQHTLDPTNLLLYVLELPKYHFDITLKYLFFTTDFTEIKRNYTSLFEKMLILNQNRKIKWKELLMEIRNQNFLKEELSDEELEYIMFLSVSIRSTYFQITEKEHYDKSNYCIIVNQFLKPYLSPKGAIIYNEWLSSSLV